MDLKTAERIFDELNEECYGNKLLKPEKFFFYDTDDSLAKVNCRSTKSGKLKSTKIGINKRFCISEEDMRGKILHEMVHIAVFMDGHVSKSRAPFIEHDRYFVREARRIRKQYGYHVPIFSFGFRIKRILKKLRPF